MKSSIACCWDLEMTCEGGLYEREVIEIGLTTVNLESLTIVRSYSFPLVPAKAVVSDFCTQLTGWTLKKLERQTLGYEKTWNLLKSKHGTQNRLNIFDTPEEADVLEYAFTRRFIESPSLYGAFGEDCLLGLNKLNVCDLYAVMFSMFDKAPGLDNMLKNLRLTFIGTRHRALDDSRNIARVFIELMTLAREGLELYRQRDIR